MRMARTEAPSLRQHIEGPASERFFWDRDARACFTYLAGGTSLGGRLPDLAGRSVLLATSSQLAAALALIELDGVARRITILPPDTDPDHLAALSAAAGADAVVIDGGTPDHTAFEMPLRVACSPELAAAPKLPPATLETEWVLLTSGTSGVPKMVIHDLASLTAPIGAGKRFDGPIVWGTFYDIRRYGGLQIFLRAV